MPSMPPPLLVDNDDDYDDDDNTLTVASGPVKAWGIVPVGGGLMESFDRDGRLSNRLITHYNCHQHGWTKTRERETKRVSESVEHSQWQLFSSLGGPWAKHSHPSFASASSKQMAIPGLLILSSTYPARHGTLSRNRTENHTKRATRTSRVGRPRHVVWRTPVVSIRRRRKWGTKLERRTRRRHADA
jgi:hypothetical protein